MKKEEHKVTTLRIAKNKLYDLYNILGSSLLDYEDLDDDSAAETALIIETTNRIEEKTKVAYQGLKDEEDAPLNLTAEEALLIVKLLNADIEQHENRIGIEDDPISYNAERAYHMRSLKEEIQAHFKKKLHDLFEIS